MRPRRLTHHGPSLRSVHKRFLEFGLNAAYVSDMEPLIAAHQPRLWIHGHTHATADYRVGATRVICNPRGYAPYELNPDFDPALVCNV